MNIKLIALDLDRTLLNKDARLSEKNKNALERAIAKGVHVCIASGRAFDTLPKDVLAVEGIEYAITSNGAAVYRIKDKECLNSYVLTEESVEAIVAATKDYPICYEAFIRGTAFAASEYVKNPVKYGASPQAVNYVQTTRHLVDDMVAFILEHKHELDSIDLIVKDENVKNQMMDIVRNVTDEVFITSSIKQLVEISYKDAGKKSGVKFLADYLGVRQEKIAAFGDADNDLDMIEYAGVGIAMANASDSLLKVANAVTDHHDNDGVANAFEKILGI